MMTFEGSLYSGGRIGLFDNVKNNSESEIRNESYYQSKKKQNSNYINLNRK